MQTKNWQPTAAQKRWHDTLRELGSVLSGLKPVEIHHCAGASAKHNKVWIGQWWVLALTHEEHSRYVPEWGKRRKFMEKTLFRTQCKLIERAGGVIPFGDDVMEAIEGYRR